MSESALQNVRETLSRTSNPAVSGSACHPTDSGLAEAAGSRKVLRSSL